MYRSDQLWRAWKYCLFTALLVLFAHAAYLRFSIPQWPFLTPDSGYYVNAALLDRIVEIGPRTIPYPLFCWGLLEITHDWRSIAITQHALGLLGPAILIWAWLYLGSKIYTVRLARAAHEILSLAIAFLLLPSSSYVLFEHMIMLESFNAFLQCVLLALFCFAWAAPAARTRVIIACGISFLGVTMYYANPRWGAAAPLSVLIAIIIGVLDRGQSRSRILNPIFIITAAAMAWLLIGLPQSKIHSKNPWTKPFTAKHLLWMHADLALVEFRRDLAATPVPANAALLRKLEAKVAPLQVGAGKSGWMTIPFNAEALLYAPDNADGDLIAAFANDPEGYSKFCTTYYWRIIRNQPLAFGARVFTELRYFYSNANAPLSSYSGALNAYWINSVQISRALAKNARPDQQVPLLEAATKTELLLPTPFEFRPPAMLIMSERFFNLFFLTATIMGSFASLVILLRSGLRSNRILFASAAICLTAISLLFFQVLTLSLVTASAPRYTEALRTLSVFSFITAVLAVGSLVVVITKFKFRPVISK